MTKKILLFFLVFIILFGTAGLVFGQPSVGRDLEIEYPEVAGEQPEKVITPVPEYVRYIYNALIWLSGLIALIVLIIGGFEWFTSAGSIDRIRSAKDRISAAVLGIIILFGSYLILISINPELVVFHLKRLRPIISELTPGVLVCKEEVEVDRAWQLANNFKRAQEYWEQKMIKEELDAILDNIALKCYPVASAGNVMAAFDNKITDIYFIPGIQKIDEEDYLADYGAILYEDSGFEGKSQPIYDHLKPGTLGGVVTPKHYDKDKLTVKISSIKPFLLIPQHHEEKFQVVLYQQYDRNKGVLDASGSELKAPGYKLKPGYWYEEAKWDYIQSTFCKYPEAICSSNYASPRSMKVGGPFIAILLTPDGRSDTFYNIIDNNLDDNLNIINWVKCKDYQSKITKGIILKACAQPAVNSLIIISAKIY